MIAEVDLMTEAGTTRTTAIGEVCRRYQLARRTVWNRLQLVEEVPQADRLPTLSKSRTHPQR
ncbi:MAG: hypothetical protein ACK4YM_06495 [Novosphingobium sp.]